MIGIIVAMQIEYEAICELVKDGVFKQYKKHDYMIGTISGKEVLVMKGGVGKVAAAISTTQILDQFDIEAVVNIGCAGGIREDEEILDVVISDRLTYHDWDCESVDNVVRSFENNQYVFHSDPKLVAKAVEAMKYSTDSKVFIGDIVSGDAFVSDPKLVEMIQTHFPSAVACEMEATSVAHACSEFDIPFVCLRSLSDIVIRENNGNDFWANVQKAAARSALFTQKFLELLD